MGLSVWRADQAGPFQAIPQPGRSWRPQGKPDRQPHEYVRNGTAKVMTLFHPADGRVRLKGVSACPNSVLHPWLKSELSAILAATPDRDATGSPPPAPAATRAAWERWREGLSVKPTLLAEMPPLRMLLVLDNLAGHKTPEFVCWLFAHGGRAAVHAAGRLRLNMAESLQRILKRRALNGQTPDAPSQIIAWFEAVADHWNRSPTPFEWGGKRAARRRRSQERRHRLGGSAAWTRKPVRRRIPLYDYEQRK